MKTAGKAHTRDSTQALSKLGEMVNGRYRIVSRPPVVVPLRDLAATFGLSASEAEHAIQDQFRAYRATLQDDRRELLERFQIVDAARKVVGVGSVGTRAFIVLLPGHDAQDPLFLQVKEATSSVLEPYVGKASEDRVVPGPAGAGEAGMEICEQRENDWTVVLRRQRARIAAGQPGGGYTDMFEVICCDCGDDPDLEFRDVPRRLQLIRGPYPMLIGVLAYEEHIESHNGELP